MLQFDRLTRAARGEAELQITQCFESHYRERKARAMSDVDHLTRLGNHAAFLNRLTDAIRTSGPEPWTLALLHIDLDGLEAVNDRYGRYVGDSLLKISAIRLYGCLRADDSIARYGRGEFVCLLRELGSLERTTQVACEVFDALSAPCRIGELQLNVQASIGIACYPDDGDAPESLLRRADAATYRARQYAMGYAFYTRALDGEPASRFQ